MDRLSGGCIIKHTSNIKEEFTSGFEQYLEIFTFLRICAAECGRHSSLAIVALPMPNALEECP